MEDLKKNKKNIILVDTSYTLFHRYFATLRWLSLSNPEIYKEHIGDKDYNWLENTIFIEKYEKLYIEGIIKLVGKRVFKDSIVIFCMDTPKEQVWRTELKCDYKGDRFDMSKKTNFSPTFKYTYNTIIPNLLKNNNMFKIRINKLEADDVIATICNYLENILQNNIYIISGDEDFLQLGRPNLYFVNFKIKKPMQLNLDDAKMALHKKILLGDKSDCIKSIFPQKFSTKIKKKLVESIDEFNEFIKTNKEIQTRYNENNKLINFNNIPNEYKKLIINEFNQLKI
jgi:5'-3' exonuclease